jgi:ATP-dependent Lhr-like helicase
MEMLQLAATDPANPYGALLRWPAGGNEGISLTRSVGARVILCNGMLIVYLRRGNPNIQVFLPDDEPQRSNVARALASSLAENAHGRSDDSEPRSGILIATVNGVTAADHWLARYLLDAGFAAGAMGFNVRRGLPPLTDARHESRPNA